MRAALARFCSRFSGEAEKRGMRLLEEHLTPAQRQQFKWRRCFDVTGGQTGTHYRIRTGLPMNVEVLHEGRCVKRLCFEPEGDLVQGDTLLAQKLALELYENDALARANYRLV